MEETQLIVIMEEITIFLANVGEENWANAISSLRTEYEIASTPQEKKSSLIRIQQIYGGMGSFSDLVLSDNNGRMLLDENAQLDDLRNELFVLLTKIR
ncbi:hypothetical protein KC887_06500 [Candidatus Kaiserbacteria bacterium]|nr:hypothetical protein [Candidatus Kaiserbacteria bacterium]